MVIRYIFFGILSLVLYVLGVVLTPLNYFIKDFVRKHNIVPLWWFLNDTEPFDDNDIDSGDFGRFKHNFFGFYRQNAIRNSHWNLRVILGKHVKGKNEDVKGEMQLLSSKWNFIEGKTSATYTVKGRKFFRKSLIKRLFKLTLIEFNDKWYKFNITKFKVVYYIHYQIGSNNYRYLYKVKLITKRQP